MLEVSLVHNKDGGDEQAAVVDIKQFHSYLPVTVIIVTFINCRAVFRIQYLVQLSLFFLLGRTYSKIFSYARRILQPTRIVLFCVE